jgi:hypothetical protein
MKLLKEDRKVLYLLIFFWLIWKKDHVFIKIELKLFKNWFILNQILFNSCIS